MLIMLACGTVFMFLLYVLQVFICDFCMVDCVIDRIVVSVGRCTHIRKNVMLIDTY